MEEPFKTINGAWCVAAGVDGGFLEGMGSTKIEALRALRTALSIRESAASRELAVVTDAIGKEAGDGG